MCLQVQYKGGSHRNVWKWIGRLKLEEFEIQIGEDFFNSIQELAHLVSIRPRNLHPPPIDVSNYVSDDPNDHCWWYRIPLHDCTGISKVLTMAYCITKFGRDATDDQLMLPMYTTPDFAFA